MALAATSASFPDAASAGPPAGFSLEPIVGGFDQATAFAHAPDGRVFVAEKPGVVKVASGGSTIGTFIDIRDRVNEFWNRGLIGIALDPRFAENHRVYLAFSEELNPSEPDGPPPAGGLVIRVEASATNPNVADPSTEVTLLDGFQSAHYSHSVGALRFDAAGRLLAALGDGASFFQVDSFALEALNLDRLQGKLVRIDPETGNGAPDNPHFDPGNPASPRSRIIAWGLRNPYRFSIDPENGDLWIGDVGWTSKDELNRLPATANSDAERNFGWPCSEGSTLQDQYPAWFPAQCGSALGGGWTRPVHEWRTGATASTAGPIYRGSAYPETYRGSIFFADFSSDQMMTFNPATGTAANFGAAEGWGGPVDIQIGPDGNLHVLGFLDGTLRRLVHTGAGTGAPQDANGSTPGTSAPGALKWGRPTRVSAGAAAARFPDVAANARGEAVAAWVERRGGRMRVVANLRSARGTWTKPTRVSPQNEAARDPSVAIGPRGHVVVSWRKPDGRRRTAAGAPVPDFTASARRALARTGRWRPVVDLAGPGRSAGRPDVAVDRSGTALFAWRAHSATGKKAMIVGAVARAGRSAAAARRIGGPSDCDPSGRPEVAATAAGRGLAWWHCGASSLAVADRRTTAGAFGAARATELPGTGRLQASLTLDESGAVFGVTSHAHGRSPIHALARPSARTPVVRAADLAGDGAAVTIAEAGEESLVAWRRPTSGGGVRVAEAGRSGAPSGQTTFDASRRSSAPSVAVGPNGFATVAWFRGPHTSAKKSAHATLVASSRAGTGSPWATPSRLSRRGVLDTARAPAIAVDGTGRVTALWSRRVGKRFVVERAEFLPPKASG